MAMVQQQPVVMAAPVMMAPAGGMVMQQGVRIAAPVAGVYGGMQRNGGVNVLAPFETLYVAQGKKGCLQEMMGCEANTEFTAAQHKVGPKIFYSVEEASCCCRFFCKAQRTSKMTMIGGPLAPAQPPFSSGMLQGMQTEKIMGIFTRKFVPMPTFNEMRKDYTIFSYDRPFRCMVGNCKLCCHQEMTFFGPPAAGAVFPAPGEGDAPVGSVIGMIKEDCWYCVPSFTMTDANGAPKWGVQQPTCCGGACVDLCAEGCCNCKIPFYIYGAGAEGVEFAPEKECLSNLAESDAKLAERKPYRGGKRAAQITKLWSGYATEAFTDADNFELIYPAGADATDKANMMGAIFFLNMNIFEAQKDQDTDVGGIV